MGNINVVVCYVRRSDVKQGLSVEAQLTQLREYADKRGLVIRSTHIEEPISGSAPLEKRPALQDAIDDLNRGEGLLSLNQARLARNQSVYYLILSLVERAKGKVMFANGTSHDENDPLSQMVSGMLALIASYERSEIRRRIKQALRVKKTKGEVLGRPGKHQYGFDAVDGLLVENEEEQATIALVKRLRADKMSYSKIVMHLAQRNMLNRSGDPFKPSYLCKLALR
jgi:DNA invertase Pin-like site-specific DNA recombinase